jgi:hypothetical protein
MAVLAGDLYTSSMPSYFSRRPRIDRSSRVLIRIHGLAVNTAWEIPLPASVSNLYST